ncbi:MAG: phosphatase PAP2 family protein [Eubacteriales bacterium]|nr:phosphatase PAP2 family protein [Eubacteriales bacterium]
MNYQNFYEHMTGRIRESGAACLTLRVLSRAATGLMYLAYPLLLLFLWQRGTRGELLRAVIVPGISFWILTAVRAFINRPRPYETWEIAPLFHKDTKGKSMPSRHVFSSAVISMAWLQTSVPVGILLLAVSAAAALFRVLGGVHYPSDVAAGYAAGILAGLLILFL